MKSVFRSITYVLQVVAIMYAYKCFFLIVERFEDADTVGHVCYEPGDYFLNWSTLAIHILILVFPIVWFLGAILNWLWGRIACSIIATAWLAYIVFWTFIAPKPGYYADSAQDAIIFYLEFFILPFLAILIVNFTVKSERFVTYAELKSVRKNMSFYLCEFVAIIASIWATMGPQQRAIAFCKKADQAVADHDYVLAVKNYSNVLRAESNYFHAVKWRLWANVKLANWDDVKTDIKTINEMFSYYTNNADYIRLLEFMRENELGGI